MRDHYSIYDHFFEFLSCSRSDNGADGGNDVVVGADCKEKIKSLQLASFWVWFNSVIKTEI